MVREGVGEEVMITELVERGVMITEWVGRGVMITEWVGEGVMITKRLDKTFIGGWVGNGTKLEGRNVGGG